MQRIAKVLSKAMKMAKVSLYDYEENEGPRYFAKSIIECITGKTEDEVFDPAYTPPDFINTFPFMLRLAKQGSNMFDDFDLDIPRKTFFGMQDDMELQLAKVQHLKQIRVSLQHRIFGIVCVCVCVCVCVYMHIHIYGIVCMKYMYI